MDVILVKYKKMISYSNKTLTHCDPVYLRVISLVVVAIKSFFSNCECGLDCERVSRVGGSHHKVLINVVHSWYDGCDAGSFSRKKQCHILKELKELLLVGIKLYEVTSRYLEDISKLVGNTPIALAEFILPKFHIAICSNGVDCCDVANSKVKHVEG